jgi:hypothetical protein
MSVIAQVEPRAKAKTETETLRIPLSGKGGCTACTYAVATTAATPKPRETTEAFGDH